MPEQDSNLMTALDQMVNTDQLQMLKAAIPYLPPSGRRALSLYAKMRELQQTISLFQNSSADDLCTASVPEDISVTDILSDMRKYCSEETGKQMDQMINLCCMLQMMDVIRENDGL